MQCGYENNTWACRNNCEKLSLPICIPLCTPRCDEERLKYGAEKFVKHYGETIKKLAMDDPNYALANELFHACRHESESGKGIERIMVELRKAFERGREAVIKDAIRIAETVVCCDRECDGEHRGVTAVIVEALKGLRKEV